MAAAEYNITISQNADFTRSFQLKEANVVVDITNKTFSGKIKKNYNETSGTDFTATNTNNAQSRIQTNVCRSLGVTNGHTGCFLFTGPVSWILLPLFKVMKLALYQVLKARLFKTFFLFIVIDLAGQPREPSFFFNWRFGISITHTIWFFPSKPNLLSANL